MKLTLDENGLVKTGEYTAVNPKYMAPVDPRVASINAQIASSPLGSQGIVQAPSAFNVSAPITSSDLSGGATPLNLPTPTPPSTTGAGISARIESSAEQAKAQYDQKQQEYEKAKQEQANSSKSLAEKYIGLGTQAIDERIAATQTDEYKALQAQAQKDDEDLITLRKSQDAEIKALETSGGAGPAIANAVNAINYRYAFQRAQMSLASAISTNKLQNAKQNITDLYNLKMEAYQPYINYYSQLAQNDQKIFNDAEVRILENKRDEYKTQQTQEADFVKQKGTAMLKAKEYGADNATIQAMSRAIDMASLAQAGGSFFADPLDRQIKQAQLAKLQTDAKEAIKKLSEPPQGTGELAQAQAKGNIDLVSGLANDKYLSSAVGPNVFGRVSLFNKFTGGKNNFIAGVEQLSSQLSLDSLIRAKANGATFGALSDSELKILSASASKLGTWAIKDGDGNVVGYKTSEGEFKKELDKINNFAKLDYLIKGGGTEDVGAQQMEDGTIWVANSDGSFTQIYP